MEKKMFPVVIILGILLLSGCAANSAGGGKSLKNAPLQVIDKYDDKSSAASVNVKEPAGEISLEDAVKATLEKHPELSAASYEIKAREGAAKQAGLLPNPKVFGEFDQIDGTGDYSGKGMMETSFGVSQEIPLGGKISKNKKIAGVEVKLAELNRTITYLELRKTVQKRFLRVYVLQEILNLEKQNLELATATCDAIGKRVESGDISSLDLNRATVELFSTRADVEVLERELEAAKYVLTSSWGSDKPHYTSVKAEYSEIPELPDDNTFLSSLEKSPQYTKLEMMVTHDDAALKRAKADFWPTVEIGGAYRGFEETDDHAYLLELNLPVPLFDRNQGGVQEARNNLSKTIKEKDAGFIELKNNTIESVKKMRAIRAWYITSRETILPAANKVLDTVTAAYNAGERNYIELLDAQRTLLKVKRSHIERLSEYMELKSDLDALIPEGNIIPVESGLKTR